MPRFAANLNWLYAELPWPERFGAAARDGFTAVEMASPYVWPAIELKALLDHHGLELVLINAPPGGHDPAGVEAARQASRKGTACVPGLEAEFRAGLAMAMNYAVALDGPRIHVQAGVVPDGLAREDVRPTYIANLRHAATEAAARGLALLVEPINRRDIPGFFLNRQDHAHEIVEEVGAPNLQVQMDLYHCQVVEGDLSMKLRHYLPTGRVGHIQVAGVPGRHEPDVGEINYPSLFALIDALGYTGWVGAEYTPQRGSAPGATTDGLGWLRSELKATAARAERSGLGHGARVLEDAEVG